MDKPDRGMVFRTETAIRFAMGDQAGVMFFAEVFPLAHAVSEEFIRACGIGWREWFTSEEYGIPFRTVQADYLRPLHPGDRVTAELRIARLGRSSVTFAVRINKEGELAATVDLTCVFVTRPEMKPRAMPETIREKLTPYLA